MDTREAREEHLRRYGSMLFCPDRDTLCVFMEGMWGTGCERATCIRDDSEYQKLQRRIETNKRRIAEKRREEESGAPIRTQRKTYEQLQWERIRALEEESQQAYRRNNPKRGEAKLYEAIRLRQKLRAYQREKER